MKIKFRSIELFGISGSGKTFLRKIIKKRLIREGYKVFDTREIIILYIGQFIETNLYENFIIIFFVYFEIRYKNNFMEFQTFKNL